MIKSYLNVSSRLILAAILLSLSLGIHNTHASEDRFTQARHDYLKALENYSVAKEEYLTSRNTYLKFKTLISKQEAYDKTKAYLVSSAELLKAYLIVFKIRVEELPGQKPEVKQDILTNIDKEVSFLTQYQTKILNTPLLEDFPKLSLTLASNYNQLKQDIKIATLTLRVAESRSQVATMSEIATKLQTRLENAKITGKNVKQIERGPLEMQNLLDLANQKLSQAQSAAQDGNQSKVDRMIEEINKLVIQSIQFAKEVISGLI